MNGLRRFPPEAGDTRAFAPSEFGGKAEALFRMSQAGLPVPPGVALGCTFFAPWNAQMAGLAPEQAGQLAFDATQTALLEALQQQLPAAPGACYAVRSSALDEDSAAASFAGIYETRLGVRREALAQAIRDCYAAAWSPRVQAYRQQRGLAPGGPGLALVVQLQLDSAVAGVGFSVNPVNNDSDEALFAANWGLGSTVVDGRINPDQFLLDKLDGRLLEARCGDKQVAEHLSPAGGVEQRRTQAASAPCLAPAQLAELLALLRQVEALFGQPVDIEWAYQDGRPHLLQARPITSWLPLPAPLQTAAGAPRRLYLDAALSKGMTSNRAFSPLGQDQLELAFRTLLSTWLGPLAPLEGADALIVFAGGRMYLNLSDLLRLTTPAKLAAGHAATDRLTADILAHIDRPRYRAAQRPAWLGWKLLWRVPRAGWRLRALFGALALAACAPQALKRRYELRIGALQADLLAQLARVQQGLEARPLSELVQSLAARLAQDAPLLLAGLVAGLAEPRWAIGKQAQGQEAELAALKRGGGGNLVVEMSQAMNELAKRLGPQALADLPALEAQLSARGLPADALQAWDAFVARFGWRGPDEMDLASPRYGDCPGLALRQLAAMVGGFDLRQALEEALQQRQLALAHFEPHLGPLRRRLLRRVCALAAQFAGTRDTPKYLNVLCNYIVRQQALRQGQAWVAAGRLDRAEQVFDLRLADFDAARQDPTLDLRRLGSERAALVHRLNALRRNFPPVIDSRGRTLSAAPQADTPGLLRGMPISPGRVRGPVRCLHSADAARIRPGEVLVAYTTDPGWTPLFINAAAVLLEVGGALQHGALVAREFGKPCVAGLPQLLERLRDGEWVEVDGAAGTVLRLPAPGTA